MEQAFPQPTPTEHSAGKPSVEPLVATQQPAVPPANSVPYVPPSVRARRHACDHPGCTKVYDAKWKLKRHKLRHTNQKNFVCDFKNCNKAFYEKHELVVHRRVHSDDRPFLCDNPRCRLGFKSRYELQGHKRKVHTLEAAERREIKLQSMYEELKSLAKMLVDENTELRELLQHNRIKPPKSAFFKGSLRLKGSKPKASPGDLGVMGVGSSMARQKTDDTLLMHLNPQLLMPMAQSSGSTILYAPLYDLHQQQQQAQHPAQPHRTRPQPVRVQEQGPTIVSGKSEKRQLELDDGVGEDGLLRTARITQKRRSSSNRAKRSRTGAEVEVREDLHLDQHAHMDDAESKLPNMASMSSGLITQATLTSNLQQIQRPVPRFHHNQQYGPSLPLYPVRQPHLQVGQNQQLLSSGNPLSSLTQAVTQQAMYTSNPPAPNPHSQ